MEKRRVYGICLGRGAKVGDILVSGFLGREDKCRRGTEK